MFQIIQFVVFALIVPLIYIALIAFDVLLVIKASNLQNRYRGLGGFMLGLLITIVIILLDQAFGGLIKESPAPLELDTVWPIAVILTVIGFVVLLAIDLLLRRGVIPFIIAFTVCGMLISGYYLLTLTQLRTATAVGAIGFMIGIIIYFIMFPTRIFNQLRGRGNEGESNEE